MHTEMWEHPAVVDNIADAAPPWRPRRRARRRTPGRWRRRAPAGWPIPPTIVAAVERAARRPRTTSPARRVVVTAGGTREPIDAVRVDRQPQLGQAGLRRRRRGGRARCRRHARVDRRPAGPRRRRASSRSRRRPRCRTPMRAPRRRRRRRRDGRRGRRLPAQGRPPPTSSRSTTGVPEIVLEPTPDILAGLGAVKRPGQVLVGFAAETDDLVANADGQARRQAPRPDRRQRRRRPRRRASATTPTPLRCCGRTPSRSTVDLADKRAIAAGSILDAIVEIRAGARVDPDDPT